MDPSFPYLDIARKRDSDTQQLSTTAPRADSRADNRETERTYCYHDEYLLA